MVSHNQRFAEALCDETWLVPGDGTVEVKGGSAHSSVGRSAENAVRLFDIKHHKYVNFLLVYERYIASRILWEQSAASTQAP